MFRGCALSVVGVLGAVIAFVLSAVIGIENRSFLTFVILLISTELIVYCVYKWVWHAGRINMDSWIESVNNFKFKYAWDGTGIAVDPETGRISLASKFNGEMKTKEYIFKDVRTWEYNLEGKVVHQADRIAVLGGGLGLHASAAVHNIGATVNAQMNQVMSNTVAEENTGFILTVADIEYPRWFIKFKPQKDLEMELLRWMEILEQSVNEQMTKG